MHTRQDHVTPLDLTEVREAMLRLLETPATRDAVPPHVDAPVFLHPSEAKRLGHLFPGHRVIRPIPRG
jgi:hypothetical protein